MKNLVKLVGIIALVAVIGFSMVGCDSGDNNNNNGGDLVIPWDGHTVTTLTENVWADGNLSGYSWEYAQYFRFVATVTGDQYIHFIFGTISGVNKNFYQADGLSATSTISSNWGKIPVITGQTYYVQVSTLDTGLNFLGTYQITFNDSETPPSAP